jgi:hypothetical protein
MHQPSQPGVFCTKMSLKLFQEIASRLLSMIKNFIVLFFALHENVANAKSRRVASQFSIA